MSDIFQDLAVLEQHVTQAEQRFTAIITAWEESTKGLIQEINVELAATQQDLLRIKKLLQQEQVNILRPQVEQAIFDNTREVVSEKEADALMATVERDVTAERRGRK